MKETDRDEIIHDHNHDGVDRRGFLKCMAWAGTGALYVMQGGVLSSCALGDAKKKMAGELSFVQLSDSHMGFNKPANPDVTATLQVALDRIKGLQIQPEFLIHTGDVSHLSKPQLSLAHDMSG
jgi:3',5'-cyclic-AMP phosphodiesterase